LLRFLKLLVTRCFEGLPCTRSAENPTSEIGPKPPLISKSARKSPKYRPPRLDLQHTQLSESGRPELRVVALKALASQATCQSGPKDHTRNLSEIDPSITSRNRPINLSEIDPRKRILCIFYRKLQEEMSRISLTSDLRPLLSPAAIASSLSENTPIHHTQKTDCLRAHSSI
jgi:hypothetical protein